MTHWLLLLSRKKITSDKFSTYTVYFVPIIRFIPVPENDLVPSETERPDITCV